MRKWILLVHVQMTKHCRVVQQNLITILETLNDKIKFMIKTWWNENEKEIKDKQNCFGKWDKDKTQFTDLGLIWSEI